VSARKHQFTRKLVSFASVLRYARQKNAHLRKVNSVFSEFFADAQEITYA